jgi:hypothetical protein
MVEVIVFTSVIEEDREVNEARGHLGHVRMV